MGGYECIWMGGCMVRGLMDGWVSVKFGQGLYRVGVY